MSDRKHIPFTSKEKLLLTEIISAEPVVEIRKTDATTQMRKNEAWERVAERFNTLPNISCKRNARQLRKFWSNLKQRTRKNRIEKRYEIVKINGGVPIASTSHTDLELYCPVENTSPRFEHIELSNEVENNAIFFKNNKDENIEYILEETDLEAESDMTHTSPEIRKPNETELSNEENFQNVTARISDNNHQPNKNEKLTVADFGRRECEVRVKSFLRNSSVDGDVLQLQLAEARHKTERAMVLREAAELDNKKVQFEMRKAEFEMKRAEFEMKKAECDAELSYLKLQEWKKNGKIFSRLSHRNRLRAGLNQKISAICISIPVIFVKKKVKFSPLFVAEGCRKKMMGDQFRKVEQYSPKSSPRGARSPVVSRQDSSGTLKTTILLGKNPSIVPSGPFYLMKEPPGDSELTGATNLMTYYGLEHSYSKFSGKKLKESLSSFLPTLPGVIDAPGAQDNSSLRSVIEKPPIVGKELLPLSSTQLDGFRLHPGPLPEQYRYVNQTPLKKHKNKHKKHKHKDGGLPNQETQITELGQDTHEKKHKKQKRHEDDKERKKRKKEKKRKKQKHSPEHSGGLTPSQHISS